MGTPQALHNAFRGGAAAIVLVGTPAQTRAQFEDLVTHISVDLPRFYISSKLAREHGLERAKRGTLTSRLRWEKREGRNLFLWVPGTDPRFERDRDECLILSCHYDTRGFVPTNAPDEEGAANCAGSQ